MQLYRFGGAAVRLDQIVSIREVPGDDEGPRVEVRFLGCDLALFDGADAEALRRYVAALADPLDPGLVVAGELPPARNRGGGVK